MKIHIISLLALLISSKVSAQHLDEKWTNMPACWNTTTPSGERVSTNNTFCISIYRVCLQALEDEETIGHHSITYYIAKNIECAEKYGGSYDVSDLQQACLKNWDGHCHKMKLPWFHHKHLRNKCRRENEGICTAIYGSSQW